jgi:alanine racemase
VKSWAEAGQQLVGDGAGGAGDLVTLIGDGLDLDAVATAAGTIGYEVQTGLGQRYHRVYRAE